MKEKADKPPVPALRKWPERATNALALELAANLSPLSDILERYGLKKKELQQILKDPDFRIRYAQAKAQWGADKNATERVIAKATLMVEDSLMTIYEMLYDTEATTNTKLAVFNSLVELSEAAPKKQASRQPEKTEKFSITINLSGGQRKFDIEASPPAIEGEFSE